MALEINRLSKGDDDMGKVQIAEVRVYRTTDGLFVGEGDPRGAYLAYGVGAEVGAHDEERYGRFMRNEAQDAADSTTAASRAYTDAETRDILRRRQAGDVTARAGLNETPALIHDRLATELADEAQAMAAAPAGEVAAIRNAGDGDEVFAEHAVWRTAEGDLVHEGDENGVTLAYAAGARIDDADVDEYNDLGAPPSADPPKAATTPVNKSARKPANK